MKRQGSTELPRFFVGALATAGASVANGATVQITFDNNVVSHSGLNNFVPDLTGDSLADVAGYVIRGTSVGVGGLVGGRLLLAWAASGVVSLGGQGVLLGTDRALVPFAFSDARINNSGVTSGFLDMEGLSIRGSTSILQIHRLIFDDASTTAPTGLTSASTGIQEWSAVPEPSSLGLLALGAGGLLARRRRAMAA